MYQFVEDLGIPGKFEASVVEDEDGFRILRIGDGFIPRSIWEQAHDSGVSMLLLGVGAATVEQFISTRGEMPDGYQAREWIDMHPIVEPTYKDLLALQVEEEDADPLATTQFVHLHTHTEFSPMDGLSRVSEVIAEIQKDPEGGGAWGSCDHGNCAVHPEQQELTAKAGMKPIFGMEAYLVDDRFRRTAHWFEVDGVRVESLDLLSAEEKKRAEKKSDSDEVRWGYNHLSLWAKTPEGLRNLWAMSTEAYRDGLFDGNPRLDWDTLARHSEGIICGTGCLRGPVARPLITDDIQKATQNLSRLHEIYGDDLYVEIHTNTLPDQQKVNAYLVEYCNTWGLPAIAAVDSHYDTPEHRIDHKIWVSQSTGKTLVEDTTMFQGDQHYHLKTAAEVRKGLDYLPDAFVAEAMANTVKIARECTATVGGEVKPPVYSKPTEDHPDPIARDVEILTDICLANWEKVVGKRHDAQTYMDRFEREMKLLIDKDFCGYFLIVWEYVKWAKDQGCLVGPGRGSGGGSLVAYLADIVEIDPVDADLIFERFLTEGRNSLPDFDIDFPTSWRSRIVGHQKDRWGHDYVSNIGTVSRLRSKGAINDVHRAMAPVLPYEIPFQMLELVKKAITAADAPLAGKHMPWDEFCAQYADMIDPMVSAYPEFMRAVDTAMDRVKTYGKHAAGVVISTSTPLTDLPMRVSEDGEMITQFDMNALEILGYVKFDNLTLRTLDTLQVCVDLIEQQFGVRINPYEWKDEYLDPQVWDEVSAGKTLGLFQIETASGTRLTRRLGPRNLLDLAAVMTVVRPGPMRSGLTESYLRRRAGIEAVTYPDPRMEAFVGDTFGSMIYQEQVMRACMDLAGYDSTEADVVRKLLGKKQVEKVVAAGIEFVRRAVEDGGTDPAVAQFLWDQMAEFAKYCLAGDTEVWLASANGSSSGRVAISDMYRRLHAPHEPRRPDQENCLACGRPLAVGATVTICPVCRCWRYKFTRGSGLRALSWWADGRIRPARILDVLHQGKGAVYDVVLSDGRKITGTSSHKVMTTEGYRRIGDLTSDSQVLTDDGYEPTTPEEARLATRLTRPGMARQGSGAVNHAFGEDNHGYIDGSNEVWKSWRESTPKVCAQCGDTEGRIEHAHLNGDHQDQRWENYAWMCASCHKAYDYAVNDRRRKWQKGHLSAPAKVISIEYRGVEDVYDLVMDSPHNFVANGVVVSNSFNKAHAFAYAVIGQWCAFFRFHYPVQFLVAALSTVDTDRLPAFVEDCRNSGYTVVPPDVNRSQVSFISEGMDVIYGLSQVKGIGEPTAEQIVKFAPYTSLDDFIERCVKWTGSKVNMGHVSTLVQVGAFDSIVPNRKAVEQQLDDESSGAAKRCTFRTDEPVETHPFNLPCRFDWANEPDPPMLPRGRGKAKVMVAKDPPKKCTTACRQYSKPGLIPVDQVVPYTKREIMDRERELLGSWITSTPFDSIPDEMYSDPVAPLLNAEEIEQHPADRTLLYAAAVIEEAKVKIDRSGRHYAFVKLNAKNGIVEGICFADNWSQFPVRKDDFVVAEILKDPKGYQIQSMLQISM